MVEITNKFQYRKRNKAKKNFGKDFYSLLNNAIYGTTKENVRNHSRLEVIKKDEFKKITKQQSKLTFSGIHKSYEYCDSNSFRRSDVKMD